MKSEFLTKFNGIQLEKRKWEIAAPLKFNDEVFGRITAEVGFQTDLASINSLRYIAPLLYALLVGYGNAACTIHDMLYKEGRLSRKACDEVLYRALRAEGVAKWRAAIFYAGVRVFGGRFYNDDNGSNNSQAAQAV
jgi:hypothetical protein